LQALNAFDLNASRGYMLLGVPGLASWLAVVQQITTRRVLLRRMGTDEGPAASVPPGVIEEIRRETSAALSKVMRAPPQDIDHDVRGMMGDISEIFSVVSPQAHQLFQGLLQSIVTQIWTAFEVLAGDLWESVLNEHPHGLAALDGKDESKKEIALNLLQRHHFDLSKLMGTILKPKYNFTALDSTRRAYFAAFAKDREEISSAITDTLLDALNLMRNLIVHKAAVIDQKIPR
jgi:hypothetical protein